MKETNPPTTRQYWRSLDRLLDSPAVQEAAASPEFPDGADLPPDALSRRTMLTIMGASFAFASLEGCRRPVEHIVPYVQAPETVIPGVPKYYATTMPLGTDAYGVVVESHEGRPTKIEGNELHPSSQGAASVWMQASILGLYDPDRSAQVRQRAAEGGSAVATWADFEKFWQGRAAELGDGAGLAVLSGAYASPTLARLRAALAARYPAARWVVYEPAGDANVFAGAELATGGAYRPVYHLDQARVVLALDADFLHTEAESVRHARGFAQGRRVESQDDAMSRLYAVESTYTVTGAAADHRLRMKSGAVAGFAAALARELGVAAPAGAAPAGFEGRLRTIAADLRAAGAAALVIAGRRQPPAVHALALAINQALGSLGTTVTLHELRDAGYGGPEALAGLVAAVEAGTVDTLVILGGNPAYDAPGDAGFAAAVAKVAHSVHLSSHFDETSRLAEWHLPATHYLEAWGDARAADGTLSVVQPLIAPLLNGRSDVEILGLLASGAHTPGHDLVRATWNGLVGDEKAWRRVLHDGLLADSAAPAPAAVGDVSAVALPAAGDGLEVTFHVDAKVHDGRYANVGWLQELPDSMTKVTWDNAALVSPATAERLGLAIADPREKTLQAKKVALTAGERTLEIPVFVLPGQADDSIAVHLGYGRTAAGRVGDGVGVDVNVLRSADAPWAAAVSAAAAAGRHELVQTQEHWTMAGRELVIEATLGEYHENPHFVEHALHELPDSQLFPYHEYDEGYQWGMTIDLGACIGCNACVVACQSENNVPIVGKEQISRGREMHWLRIDRYFVSSGDGHDEHGVAAEPEMAFQPIPCMHCENAPCEQVCPVAATVHDAEGINAMVYNRCIGTRYCSNNCPYKVRRFNFFNYTKDTPEILKIAANPDVTVRSRGVMEKCSYCLQRVSEAKIAAKSEGRQVRDGEIKTACQQTCPSDAIVFGNVNDPESRVSRLKARELNYTLLGELNNRPRTSFLARLRNPNPEWETKA